MFKLKTDRFTTRSFAWSYENNFLYN